MPSSILLAIAGLSGAIFGGGAAITIGLVGVWGFSTTALGGLLLSVGLAVGSSLLQAAFRTSPKQQDVQANIRQAMSARRRHHGRVKTGSVIVFGFRRDQKIYMLHYIGEGPINGYVTHFLQNKAVTLDVNGYVTDAQYQYRSRSRVQILTTLGTMADEPFAEILAAFPELDDEAKPFRHRGCAMALVIIEEVAQKAMMDVYPNGIPTYQTIIDGLSHYDPRDETTALTDNASLCLLAEVMDVYGLTSADDEDINFASFEDFADHSDEAVALKAGGTEPRYRTSGTILMDAENEPRLRVLADACNAHLHIDASGRFAVRKRLDTATGIALRAKNGDHLAISLESGRGLQRKSNTLKGVYVEPALNWKENQSNYRNAAAFAADGQEFSEVFDIRLCRSGTQAQRLTKMRWHELNPAYSGSLTSGLQALELLENPAFTLDLAPEDDLEIGCSAVGIELDEASLAVQFGLVSYAEGADTWDAATEEQDVVEVPPDLTTDVDDIALDLDVTVGTLTNAAPVLRFTWEPSDPGDTLPDSWSQQIQVAVDGTDEWFDASINQEEQTAFYGPIADGETYSTQIRNIPGGSPFDWQAGPDITVQFDTVLPGDLTGVSVTGNQLGHVDVAFTAPVSANVVRVKVYRNLTGTLNRATDEIDDIPVTSGQVKSGLVYGDDSVTNLLSNPGFDTADDWTFGTGWTHNVDRATKSTPGTQNSVSQTISALTIGNVLRIGATLSGLTTGGATPRLLGGAILDGSAASANGVFTQSVTATGAHTTMSYRSDTLFDGSVDDTVLFVETVDSLPQGTNYFWLAAENPSGVEGAVSGPHATLIY